MTKHIIEDSILAGLADAIRAKSGLADKFLPSAMPAAIDELSIGGEVPDGSTWVASNSHNKVWKSLHYANGMWVAGVNVQTSPFAYLYYSEDDGETWTACSGTTMGYHYDIFYADGVWVSLSSGNGVFYSEDGKTWSKSNITTGGGYNLCYGDGVLIFGSMSTSKMGIYYSEDKGKTWIQSNITNKIFIDVCYGNGTFIASSGNGTNGNVGLYYSEDGKTWTQSNITSGGFGSVAYGDGKFVAGCYNGGLYYSENGKVWIQSNITSGRFDDVCYADGIWVAVNGDNPGTGIYYSEDNGKTWIQSNITNARFVSSFTDLISHANGVWIAGAIDTSYYSEDGRTWYQSDLAEWSNVVAFGNDRWLIGGDICIWYTPVGGKGNHAWRKVRKDTLTSTVGNMTVSGSYSYSTTITLNVSLTNGLTVNDLTVNDFNGLWLKNTNNSDNQIFISADDSTGGYIAYVKNGVSNNVGDKWTFSNGQLKLDIRNAVSTYTQYMDCIQPGFSGTKEVTRQSTVETDVRYVLSDDPSAYPSNGSQHTDGFYYTSVS